MSLVERLLRITMCLWLSGSPTWRRGVFQRAMVLVRDELAAARERLLSEAGMGSFYFSGLMRIGSRSHYTEVHRYIPILYRMRSTFEFMTTQQLP
jgi:hypothetical protein